MGPWPSVLRSWRQVCPAEVTRAGRRDEPGAAAGRPCQRRSSPPPAHGQMWGDARSIPQTRGTRAGSHISSLIRGDHPSSAALCSDLTPLGMMRAAGEVSGWGGLLRSGVEWTGSPSPCALVNTPIWTGPSSHPTLLCHCLFNCLSATSECILHADRDWACLRQGWCISGI